MIISRYLRKEIFNTLIAVTLVLLLLFLSNQFVRYLNYVASGKWGVRFLFQLLAFEVPHLLVFLLPLSLYLSIILVYGRLYADNELRILEASGVGLRKLVWMTLPLIAMLTILVGGLTLWINPSLEAQKNTLEYLAGENILDRVMPGRFQVIGKRDQRVIYVERMTRDRKKAQNIFLAEEQSDDNQHLKHWMILSAATAYQRHDFKNQDRWIIANDGYRYEGIPGQDNYKIIQFKKYAVRISEADAHFSPPSQEMFSTAFLWDHYQNSYSAAELQWRIVQCISTFLLGLLAIPLSYVRPRHGRYLILVPAILLYIIYINSLFIVRHWVEAVGDTLGIGIGWVCIELFLVILLLMVRRSGRDAPRTGK